MDKIVMIEAGANEVDEDTMLNAIKVAHVEIKKIIEFINKIVAERGKPKIDFQVVGLDMDVFHAIQNKYLDDFKAAMDTDDKNVRDAALLPIMDKIAEEYPDLSEADLDLVSYKMQKYVVRSGHSAPGPRFRYVHPRPDPGADHLHPGRHQGQPADG